MKRLTRQEFLRISGVGITGLAFFAGAGCRRGSQAASSGNESTGDKVYKVRYSHVSTPESAFGQAAEIFKKKVEETSGGKIKVEVFSNSSLYGQEDELQALQSGSVEMVMSTTSVVTSASPKFLLFDLPFVFSTGEDIPKILSRGTDIGKAFYENSDLAQRNMKVLGIGHSGFKQLTSNSEMRTPGDLQGLKMRVQASDVLRSQMKAWGANAIAMPFAELYNGLQQGVVDGQENPYTSIYSTKVHEVQSHLSELNHGYNLGPIMVNTQFFDALPEDLQKAMTKAGKETSSASQEYADGINAKDKQRIKEAGDTQIYVPRDKERQSFRDKVVPKIWSEYAGKVGPELVDELKDYYS